MDKRVAMQNEGAINKNTHQNIRLHAPYISVVLCPRKQWAKVLTDATTLLPQRNKNYVPDC